MADLPEYKRTTGIEPGTSPLGFGQALHEFAQTQNVIGDFGLQVAKDIANEQARVAGLEAGKTPGRALLPAIGEADKQFLQSYKTQEYNIALTNGGRMLHQLSQSARKNLSPKGLLDYDAFANHQIDELVKTLTPENAQLVQTELRNQYLNRREDLSNAVFTKGQNDQKDNFKLSFDSYGRQIIDAANRSDGTNEGIKRAKEEAIRITNDWITQNIDSGAFKGLFSEAELREMKAGVISNLDTALKMADATKLIRDGKMANILKERSTLPATPDNMRTTEIYANMFNTHNQLVSAREEQLVTQAATKRTNGTLSMADMISLKNEVSPLRYAHFELDTAKFNAANKQKADLFNYFDQNRANGMALSVLSGTDLDKAFDEKVKRVGLETGQAPNIYTEANLAKDIDIAIPSFNNKLKAGINSNNPQLAVAAANIYSSLARDHGNAVSGVDAKSAMKANMISRQISEGTEPNEAYKYASDKLDNLTPAQLEENKTLFKEELANRELKNPSSQKAMIAARLNFSPKDMPPGLQTDYMDQLQKNYIISRDWDAANQAAADQLKRSWKQTTVNGFKQVMWMPPDAHMDSGIIRESIREDADKIFAAQHREFQKKDSIAPFYFKMIQTPAEKALTDVGIKYAENKQVHIAKVDIDGKETPGILLVSADSDTAYPEPGKAPSYSMQFLPDGGGVPQLIYEPDNWSNARFALPINKVNALMSEDKQRQEAKKLELEARAIESMQQQDAIRNLRIELGEDLFYEG